MPPPLGGKGGGATISVVLLHVIVTKPEVCIATLERRPKTPPVDGNHDQNE